MTQVVSNDLWSWKVFSRQAFSSFFFVPCVLYMLMFWWGVSTLRTLTTSLIALAFLTRLERSLKSLRGKQLGASLSTWQASCFFQKKPNQNPQDLLCFVLHFSFLCKKADCCEKGSLSEWEYNLWLWREKGHQDLGGFFFFFPPFFSKRTKKQTNKKGVCHTLALPFTLKGILRQKKNYENSNTSPCKNIIFKNCS